MPKFTLFIAISTALILAACSGGGSDRDQAGPAEPADTGVPAEEAGEPDLAALIGDAAQGERVFARCAACHSVDTGVTRIGPSLAGIVGRDIGGVEGFRYSAANQAAEGDWTPERLFEYLENPRAFMPGTSMSFVGLADAQERADLIAFLESQS